jgi:SWI/SNF-related matrix-associated actin-dependent regulator 1 of chromatin subfamily A
MSGIGEILITPREFRIIFPWEPYLVEQVKKLPDRIYDPVNKIWVVPIEHRLKVEKFAHLYKFNFLVSKVPEQDFTIAPLPELEIDIDLKMTLRHYQRGGVAYNLLHKKVIIGDDMGLGKTGQAIATLVAADMLFTQTGENPVYPCLVICPNSTKYGWQDQWLRWTGRNLSMILSDQTKKNWHLYWQSNMAKVFIVNYESLKKYFVKGEVKGKRLNEIKFDERITIFNSIVIDEIHKVKDAKIQQSKFTKGIATGKNWIFGLTGTPVVNDPGDLASQLIIIDQISKFGGYSQFMKRYRAGERKASNLDELNFLLNKHCYYRRSKQEVAKELPPKSRQIVLCDITNRKEYDDAENNLINYLRQYKNANDEKIASALRGKVMVSIGILKNISARGKLKDVKEYIDDMIENGEKIGIFIHLKEVAQVIKGHYPNSASITGEDKLNDRQAAITKFKNDRKCMTAILSLMAAGTGVDGLQYASSTVAFIEQPWTAAACDQAEDRFNRIGQTKPVQCLYFLGRNTIDTHVYDIIQNKRDIADKVTGNTDEVKIDFINEIANLLNIKR